MLELHTDIPATVVTLVGTPLRRFTNSLRWHASLPVIVTLD
jgi:hypothetical protein